MGGICDILKYHRIKRKNHMKLFIIRHGDPNYALDTLTERGWREAELLRDRLMRENITKVYLSPPRTRAGHRKAVPLLIGTDRGDEGLA